MEADRAIVKAKLTEYYNWDAPDYHKRNYLNETSYSPLRFRQRNIEQIIESAGAPRGSKILDVGCGPGRLVLSLLKKGYRVWGVDISSSMIDEATKLVQGNGFPSFDQLAVGDIEAFEFDEGFFDVVVVASGVIEYQETDDVALNEMNRVLANGGHLIVNVTNRYSCTHLFDAVYRPLKMLPLACSVLGTIKRHVLHRGDLVIIPPARTHRPSRFDRILEAHGFKKLCHHYFDFTPLPAPFNSLLHSLCLRVGEKMERLSTIALGRLGGGYLVMARKAGSAPTLDFSDLTCVGLSDAARGLRPNAVVGAKGRDGQDGLARARINCGSGGIMGAPMADRAPPLASPARSLAMHASRCTAKAIGIVREMQFLIRFRFVSRLCHQSDLGTLIRPPERMIVPARGIAERRSICAEVGYCR
jgi:ubiquinone/menaquinone biosynthesis C-methylase UbiE